MKTRGRGSAESTQEIFGVPAEQVPEYYLVAHIDGGARGNPGHAGFGVVIEDHAGRKLDEIAEYIGKTTNNVAEYTALVSALTYALRHHFKAVKILSDSELLVKQIRGEYKVRNAGLLEPYNKAKAMIRELSWFKIQHIPREQNREADHLANVAMDRAYTTTARATSTAAASTGAESKSATARAQEALFASEVEGVVRNGVVEIPKGKLPEGARVVVRVK